VIFANLVVCLQDQQQLMQQAMWQQLMAQQQAAAGGGRGRHKGSPADAAALQEQMQAMYVQMMAGMQPGKQALGSVLPLAGLPSRVCQHALIQWHWVLSLSPQFRFLIEYGIGGPS
jgi:hypothetical protein